MQGFCQQPFANNQILTRTQNLKQTFQLDESANYQTTGWMGLVFVNGFALAAAWAFLCGDELFHLTAAGFAVGLWGLFSLLSVYLIAFGRNHQLVIGKSTLSMIDAFSTRRIRFKSVKLVSWRCLSAKGSLSLRTTNDHLAIDLAQYKRSDRTAICNLIRARVSDRVQEGWDEFNQRWYIPGMSQPAPTLINRLRWHLSFVVLLVVALPLLAIAGIYSGQWASVVAFPVFLAMFWAWLTPKLVAGKMFED